MTLATVTAVAALVIALAPAAGAGDGPESAPVGAAVSTGSDTVGAIDGRTVSLRNSNSAGAPDRVFAYGRPGDTLVFGDWDGDGTDTVGAVRGRRVFLRNSNSGGRADRVFAYGRPGDTLVFGDWDGDGTDTVGVVRGSEVFLRNSNTSGRADVVFEFAPGSDRLVFGNWDGRTAAAGVLVTPTGVVVPILAAKAGSWLVRTPCGEQVRLTRGTVVDHVDVLIDPGHGGNEPGATGANGLSERNLNLVVAKELRRLLVAEGYSVLLTRSFDHRLAIQIRAQIANALDPDLFVSIHHNGGAVVASSTPGTEVFVQHDSAASRRLGGILYEELVAAAERFPTAWVATLRAGVSSRLNAAGGDFYGIHRRTPRVVSVITEFLYLSNPPEAALLARPAVQRAEARALADGIIRWFDTRDPGSGYLPDFVDTTDSGAGGFENCTDPALQ